jgi:hypothetical protein
MMSRITIHLKRAGDRLRDNTTLSSPNTIFFNRDRRRSSPQFWDHPFDTSMPEQPRLSADQTPPLAPTTLLPPRSPSTIDDVAEGVSTAEKHHDEDLILTPPPLVIAHPKISDLQIV